MNLFVSIVLLYIIVTVSNISNKSPMFGLKYNNNKTFLVWSKYIISFFILAKIKQNHATIQKH